jgi:hypothetical protein
MNCVKCLENVCDCSIDESQDVELTEPIDLSGIDYPPTDFEDHWDWGQPLFYCNFCHGAHSTSEEFEECHTIHLKEYYDTLCA